MKKDKDETASLAMPSPIPYLGGKSKLKGTIFERIPPHTFYFEPFVGGGSIFFGREPSQSELINDINNILITLYKVFKEKHEELIASLQWELCSRTLFVEYLDDLRNPEKLKKLSDVEIAKRYLYVIKFSFASQGKTFGTGTTCKPHLNFLTIEETITKAYRRLCRVTIECMDFREIFKRYNRKYGFCFIDPPYLCNSARAYFKHFEKQDFIDLRDILLNEYEGKFLLTLNDHPFLLELFEPHFRVERVQTVYSVMKSAYRDKNRVEELLISNYDPVVN